MPRLPTNTADAPPRIEPAPRGATLRLQCPECTHRIPVPRDRLVAGAAVHCNHCGSEPELGLEMDEATGRSRWVLMDPLADYGDEHG